MLRQIFLFVTIFLISSCSHHTLLSSTDVLSSLKDKNLKKFQSFFSQKLKDAISEKVLVQILDDFSEKYGKLLRLESANENREALLAVMYFDSAKIVLRLPKDSEGKIDGIWFDTKGSLAYAAGEARIVSFDGLELSIVIDEPKESSKGTVLIIHGSGPTDFNGNSIGEAEKKLDGLYFKLARSFADNGYRVVRYNKRASELNFKFQKGEDISGYENKGHFLTAFQKDAELVSKFIAKRFNEKNLFIVGHSQGSSIALQLPFQELQIKGLMLVGYTEIPILASTLTQYVYRNRESFLELDKDKDNFLSQSELDDELKKIVKVFDIDKDNKLSLSEFDTVGMVNYQQHGSGKIIREMSIESLNMREHKEILKDINVKTYFVQGEWDHQTPAFHAKSIQILNNELWKNTNLKFELLPEIGHVLNKQKKPLDFDYLPASDKLIDDLVKKFDRFLFN